VKVLVLDNYDSFTFNLVHYIEQVTQQKPDVYRNNEIVLNAVQGYDKICISPGPGLPKDAGITLDVIKNYSSTKSILGVCLGHQAIAEAFGNTLKNMEQVLHGVARKTTVTQTDYLFAHIPSTFMCGRYHSWSVSAVQEPLQTIAKDDGNNIMALRHAQYDVRGVQFHPESILTEHGLQLIKNWLQHAN
jgi:anthranilate synthase component 2